MKKFRFQKMTCFPASTHVSISIYTLELEKKSSVAVTFTLFVNAQLTFSPVKYPYCVLRRLLLSIQKNSVAVTFTLFVSFAPSTILVIRPSHERNLTVKGFDL